MKLQRGRRSSVTARNDDASAIKVLKVKKGNQFFTLITVLLF